MKYNVGDRVRIVEKWNAKTNQTYFGGMDKWLGKVMTVRSVQPQIGIYTMEEDQKDLPNLGCGWDWNEACIAGLADESDDKQKIVITTDGKETLARLYNGKNVIESATAKCHPDDAFDFKKGAKIAMERLMGEDKPEVKGANIPNTKNWRVVNRDPVAGDYIRLKTDGGFHFNQPGDILKIDTVGYGGRVHVYGRNHKRETDKPNRNWTYFLGSECEIVEAVNDEPEKPAFVPHLFWKVTKWNYGNIGTPTNYKDAVGRPLSVGDTVELYNRENEYKGEYPVCYDKADHFYIMSIAGSCDSKTGSTGNWKIIKKRSFEQVKDGEKVDDIEYIKTER